MRKEVIEIDGLEGLEKAADRFVSLMDDYTIFAFYGEMGAGKTTFINALSRHTTAELIYHFDLYRLESLEEAMDIGVEDYFDSGVLCLLEWPERIEPMLPDDTVRVDIAADPDSGRRTLTVTLPDE